MKMPVSQARIVRHGSLMFVLFGIPGAIVTAIVLDAGFIGLAIGLGLFGTLGKTFGLITAWRSPPVENHPY